MNFQELNKKGMGMYIDLDKYGLSSFALKIIAVVTMLIDHICWLKDFTIQKIRKSICIFYYYSP